tara:strand:+ start:1959 stop:2657 length:699 start_codon:yes stop_codon:yes gene_type:complete
MAVPNTNTFTLQDVVNYVNPPTNSLSECFATAGNPQFDPLYAELKNQLLDFRNYGNISGLTSVLGGNNLSSTGGWSFYSLDISDYAGLTAKLVIEYTSGNRYTGDFQIGGNIVAGSTTWNPNSGLNSFETSTSSVTSYSSVSWTPIANATTFGRWNRRTGNTPSGGTGVTSASPVGYFYYAETSGNNTGYPDKKIWLKSPNFSITNSDDTIEFYMGHFGATVNEFKIYLDIQ